MTSPLVHGKQPSFTWRASHTQILIQHSCIFKATKVYLEGQPFLTCNPAHLYLESNPGLPGGPVILDYNNPAHLYLGVTMVYLKGQSHSTSNPAHLYLGATLIYLEGQSYLTSSVVPGWKATRVYPCARIYRPSFHVNKPKTLVFIHTKRAFWACYRENRVYNFGHWSANHAQQVIQHSYCMSGKKPRLMYLESSAVDPKKPPRFTWQAWADQRSFRWF